MVFEFGKYKLISIEYDQNFIDSDLKLFGNVDFIARFAGFLGCALTKTSVHKTIKLKIQVGEKVKELDLSYDQAHKLATKFMNYIKETDADFLDGIRTGLV